MKKILTYLVVVSFLLLTGCSKTEQDPYRNYRGMSSATLFFNGEKALAGKNYDKAVKYLEALDALYPFGPYAEQGQLDIIYAYYMNGDTASSITAADRFVRLYPRNKNVDYAYFMRGVVGFNLGLSWLQRKVGVDPGMRDIGNLQQSFTAFSSLTQQFPRSKYRPDALLRMAYVRNLLAAREVQIAEFYLERKAYVAATNRASDVVEHFQGSPSVTRALAIMVEGYRKLGLTSMANSSYRILQENYPYSSDFRSLPAN